MPEQKHSPPFLKQLLKRYVAGDVTEQEKNAVDAWFANIGHEHQLADTFSDSRTENRIRKAILKKLRKSTNETKIRLSPFLRYAAAVFLFAGIILLLNLRRTTENNFRYSMITASRSEIKNIVLPDGSRIILNAKSSLGIASDFNMKDRKIKLEGEAFFVVAKDKSRPFIIQSGTLKTTVLGTSFNINAYPDQNEFKIAVATGKVKVTRKINHIDEVVASGMTHNQLLTYKNSSHAFTIQNADARLFKAWSDGELFIDDATIEQIAHRLSIRFNVQVIELPKNNYKSRYTIKLGHADLATALSVLSEITNYQFINTNNQIIIMQKK